MKNPDLFNESNAATFCPESNKLHLYVGRVPRDEYEALRKEGWTSTPKQSEAGQGEFAATWTPSRRDTALSYAGIIGDEDAGPAERAADRAERFEGYLGKRISESSGFADKFDSQPSAHGFQSQARAERAAERHDRLATKAVDIWSKAEYWQTRTAGVISHALYVSTPAVRMGRIKTIEAEIRKIEADHKKAHAEFAIKHSVILSIAEHAEGKREKMIAFPGWQYSVTYIRQADNIGDDADLSPEQLRRCMISAAFSGEYPGRWSELRKQVQNGEIEAAAVAREWLDAKGWATPEPYDFTKSDWHQHLTLRLAYENQMLEAQGGRAAFVEMIPGGWLGSRQIEKVNKSTATGRVVSVTVRGPRVEGWAYMTTSPAGKDYSLYQIKTERLGADVYRPPTPEELEAFHANKKAAKAAAPKKETIPLINPTDADAERLQSVWNERALASHCESNLRRYSRDYAEQFKSSTVCRITQATYSENSKGSHARAETRTLHRDRQLSERVTNMWSSERQERDKQRGKAICQIRQTSSDGSDYGAKRVIVLTDKPQKPLPAAVWESQEVVNA